VPEPLRLRARFTLASSSIGSIRFASPSGARKLFTRFDTGHFCALGGCLHHRRLILGVTVFPLLEVSGLQDHRNPVMHFGDELIRLCDYHRAVLQIFSGLCVVPDRPQGRERDRLPANSVCSAGGKKRNQTFNRCSAMAINLAQVSLTNLPTGRAIEAQPRPSRVMAAPMVGWNQRSWLAACLAFQIPSTRFASRTVEPASIASTEQPLRGRRVNRSQVDQRHHGCNGKHAGYRLPQPKSQHCPSISPP
jgi:hypothetical protein